MDWFFCAERSLWPVVREFDEFARFTQMFGERGFVEAMNLDDCRDVFGPAVATIEHNCNDFVPPG
jgi:hypothetical protein